MMSLSLSAIGDRWPYEADTITESKPSTSPRKRMTCPFPRVIIISPGRASALLWIVSVTSTQPFLGSRSHSYCPPVRKES